MLEIVPAIERFSKVTFTTGKDWFTHPPSYFSCGTCAHILTIVIDDLVRHEGSAHTNLSKSDEERVEVANASKGHTDAFVTSFFDFYCPQCHHSVRVYYFGDELTGLRNWMYELRYVIEKSVPNNRV